MEFPVYQFYQPSLWHYALAYPPPLAPENHVRWTETPDSHIYYADLPGVLKEEIRVEVEDSIYLIIRTTEAITGSGPAAKSFMRKFRLPERIDIEAISAGYEDGVLTVTVPRLFRRSRVFSIDPADVPQTLQLLARAA